MEGGIVDNTVHKTYEPTDSSDDKTTLCAIFLIVLTAILVTLILNIYTRWYLNRRAEVSRNRQHRRRQQHVFATAGTTNTTTAPNRGLDFAVLNSIPIFTYSESEDETSTEYCQECAVCLCEFEEGEKGRTLPGCNHSFHVECIDMWFHSHSTCPLCRACVESVGVDDQFVLEMISADRSPFSGSVEEDVAKLSWSGLLSAENFLRLYYGRGHRNELGEESSSVAITATAV